jgi:hypothetical protein
MYILYKCNNNKIFILYRDTEYFDSNFNPSKVLDDQASNDIYDVNNMIGRIVASSNIDISNIDNKEQTDYLLALQMQQNEEKLQENFNNSTDPDDIYMMQRKLQQEEEEENYKHALLLQQEEDNRIDYNNSNTTTRSSIIHPPPIPITKNKKSSNCLVS